MDAILWETRNNGFLRNSTKIIQQFEGIDDYDVEEILEKSFQEVDDQVAPLVPDMLTFSQLWT